MIPGVMIADGDTLTASASPDSVFYSALSFSGSTPAVTALVSGGQSPYTFSWTRVSGDPQIFVTSPSSSSTAFGFSLWYVGSFSALFKCTITDNSGSSVDIFVPVSVSYFG